MKPIPLAPDNALKRDLHLQWRSPERLKSQSLPLCLHTQKAARDFLDLTIYEKNPEVGGTWFENIYPGVACDVPVHSYQFPFAPNPAWSSYYASGKEIQEYIVSTAEKYDLKEKIKFNTKLVKAIWCETQGKWKLQLQQGGLIIEDEADIVLDGSGVLNQWKWQEIEGLDTFKGKLRHTARWDPEYNYEGKKIAVLGNGSSGIQRFQDNPDEFLEYRKSIEGAINSVYNAMISGSEESKALYEWVQGVMRSRLSKNAELVKTLIPTIAFSKINRITPNGIETDEGEEEFDLIVCATGFNYSFIPPWELIGRDSRRLDEGWKDTAEAYFATCAAKVPNYFIFGGPNYPIATEDIKPVVVKDSVVHAYNKFAQETLKRCVWSKGCHAWYNKRNEGADNTVTAMYPGSVLHFKACIEKLRPEHFEIQYNTSNPFRFMGNG
ncbi:hypothetical protein AFLA_013169 [Aspergillus flavus NRRL3357]|nr:hypothetical protein AFLA_013169 [Aspergillus flavus NRRL3357]